MENKNIVSRLTPGFVQRAIMKSWMPFGDGMSEAMMGSGAPAWLKSGKQDLVEQGYGMNPTVYMIVSWITRQASQIPWVLYEVKDQKWLNRYKNMDPTDAIMANIYQKKALESVDKHQLLDVWAKPNELQGQGEFIEQVLGFKLVTGDTYIHGRGPLTGPNSGLFIAMDSLPAHLIGIKYGGPGQPVGHYYWLGDPTKHIQPENVMHSKYWNFQQLNAGGLYGMSPLKAASRLITRNNDSITASVKALQNMGAIGMLSQHLNAPGDKGMTPEQAQMVEKKYYEKFGGPTNRGKIMVVGKPVQWQQMGMSPVDLKILEQEQMDLRQMCGVYHLQSQLFNDPENKTYNNMKEAVTAGLTQCVIPELRTIRDELNRWWIPAWSKRDGKNYYFDMDLQAIPELQKNMKELMEWLQNADMLTLDEKRSVIDYEPKETPGMDQIWMDGSKITPEQAMMDVDSVDKWMNPKL